MCPHILLLGGKLIPRKKAGQAPQLFNVLKLANKTLIQICRASIKLMLIYF